MTALENLFAVARLQEQDPEGVKRGFPDLLVLAITQARELEVLRGMVRGDATLH